MDTRTSYEKNQDKLRKLRKEYEKRFNTDMANLMKLETVMGMKLRQYYDRMTGFFDLMKLDEDMIVKYGNYMDGKTSFKTFISKKFGDEAARLIDALIHHKEQ